MSDRNTMLTNMERLRAGWEKDKDDTTAPASGPPLETLPTRVISQNCEICGDKFGSRVYYDNASAKETAFCSPEHVQEYREKRKARTAPPTPPSTARRPRRKEAV